MQALISYQDHHILLLTLAGLDKQHRRVHCTDGRPAGLYPGCSTRGTEEQLHAGTAARRRGQAYRADRGRKEIRGENVTHLIPRISPMGSQHGGGHRAEYSGS